MQYGWSPRLSDMRILFIADGRSPIALNWISQVVRQGHQVHLASTFPCQPIAGLASLVFIPTAFSNLKRGSGTQPMQPRGAWSPTVVGTRTRLRQLLGPLTLPAAAKNLGAVIEQIHPQLIHAMRIPYEGMLAALAAPTMPLLISVWGNDFTLHAPSTPLMRRRTQETLAGAAALHADCFRDIRLGRAWGFPDGRPALVLPGGGGVQLDKFFPPSTGRTGTPLVINPRGFRAYIRNDTFFQAIPLILKQCASARFLCIGMQGSAQAEGWARSLGIARQVDLLPPQSRSQMADLFAKAMVMVSPSTHDGTPNTLLEAMASGCFPVVGDLESLREWIIPGVNGLVVDPMDPVVLAGAVSMALSSVDLHQNAANLNRRLVEERAEHGRVMRQVEEFYQSLS